MKWPLSMSFAKLISRTADAGQARYTTPGPGLLNPDTTYYLRVRRRDDKGVWGPWSRPGASRRGDRTSLATSAWISIASATGASCDGRPARRVASRRRTAFMPATRRASRSATGATGVTVGASGTLPPEFPANLVVETTAVELEVVGSHVGFPGANKAFYRVVAVDPAGNRSGPSDYAAAPRPVIISEAGDRGDARGMPYRYGGGHPIAGRLRTRVIGGKETMGFWDVERPRVRHRAGAAMARRSTRPPACLSGTPDRPGPAEVVVSARLEREARRLHEASLKWGVEKVDSLGGTETAGTVTQTFVIDVCP